MIGLTYSNRTEHLVRALAERVAQRTDPLRTVTIIVPNRPMERWVEMRLAESLGIAANLRFVRLERFVSDWLAQRGAGHVLEASELEGRLLAVLLDPAALERDPELEALRVYLAAAGAADEDAIDRRRAQLASRLARLYQEYGFSRPAMLESWATGALALEGTPFAATERWQRALWTAARTERADPTLLDALRAVASMPAIASDAPREEALVFGVSYVARSFQQAIATLGASMDLHVYALNPCQEFWEDALSDVEQRRVRRSKARTEDDPYALLAENDNPLLRAWGRPGREHVALLDELTGFDAHASFEDPGDATLLARLQSSILERAPVAAGVNDGSVRILACPSIRRELETVATEIWSLVDRSMATSRPYRFHEIAVLVNGPDRDRYLPHLEAVFAESHDLPWNAADLALASRSRVADCALRLIDLPSTSFTRAELLEVVAHPLVLARWPDAEPPRVAAICARLGVFHGIDARDHRGTYLADASAHTAVHWDQAIRRLALGAVMEGERSGRRDPVVVSGLHLHPEEIAGSDDLATGLGLLVRSLASDARFAREAKLLPSAWGAFFTALLEAYIVPTDSAEEGELRRCLAALAALAKRDAGAPISYRIASELAHAELEALPASRGEPLGDGVVVATLLPMRAIPFRAIFVLGLGEGRFPAREAETGLDLRAAQRRPGDVAIDERDRYTFLETLLCARERLVLSYIARDELTGETREPSSIVHALEEAAGAPLERIVPPLRRHDIFTRPELDAITAHALPAAAEEARARASGAGHRRALADARFPEAALAQLAELDERRVLLAMPVIPRRERVREPSAGRETISIEQIWRFLACPIQGHARSVIGGSDEAPDGAAIDEPFEADARERERVLLDVFLSAIDQDDAALTRLYDARVLRSAAHGLWPLGPLATLRQGEDRAVLDVWRRGLERFGDGAGLHRVRFGAGSDPTDLGRDRPRAPVPLPIAGGKEILEIVGHTRWLLPSGDALVPTTRALGGDGERAKVETLKLALRAFVDHAILALAGGAAATTRRAWIVDHGDEGPLAIQLAPMRQVAAERWLASVIDDLRTGPHGVFLPCEAVLRVEGLFSRGSEKPSEDLARSIEDVRTKSWAGGSSRWGPVRDAIEHPAPEPAQALAMASRRFGAFFDHLRGMRRQP